MLTKKINKIDVDYQITKKVFILVFSQISKNLVILCRDSRGVRLTENRTEFRFSHENRKPNRPNKITEIVGSVFKSYFQSYCSKRHHPFYLRHTNFSRFKGSFKQNMTFCIVQRFPKLSLLLAGNNSKKYLFIYNDRRYSDINSY